MMILRYALRSRRASNARSFPGSSTPLSLVINSLLPRLETAQVAWSFLTAHYNCTHDSTLQFHLEFKLYQMRQDYCSQIACLWEQLAVADLPLKYAEDI
jgi:hypothetical protein